jgi:methylenetetrahydrofolate reductase (NADPH)
MVASPTVSFEIFPPKTEEGHRSLDEALADFAAVRPAFLSVTYGADGSGQHRTVDLVDRLIKGRMPLAAHVTCVGAKREQVDALAHRWLDMGIRRLVALRGDVPGGGKWVPHEGGYTCAADLVSGLAGVGRFDIAVAAYPEAHPDSPSEQADLENLNAKQDGGAALAITQYCFDTDTILRFRDKARAAGITIPIAVGVMPIVNFVSIERFSVRCGASIPPWLATRFDGLENGSAAADAAAVEVATRQCRTLAAEGFDMFHFYTLNRSPLSLAVCRALGVNRKKARAA